MPYIMNALPTPVSVKVFGNWHSFSPGQIKLIHNEAVANFMSEKRGDDGLVSIPEETMEMKLENPDEFKKVVEDRRIAGIQARCKALEYIKSNLFDSLQKDLKRSGSQVDALFEASKPEIAALKELKSLREVAKAAQVADIEDLKKLREELDGADHNQSDAREAAPRNTDSAKPAPARK